jgi:hypothetical protein
MISRRNRFIPLVAALTLGLCVLLAVPAHAWYTIPGPPSSFVARGSSVTVTVTPQVSPGCAPASFTYSKISGPPWMNPMNFAGPSVTLVASPANNTPVGPATLTVGVVGTSSVAGCGTLGSTFTWTVQVI